jgi:hypothetical protein
MRHRELAAIVATATVAATPLAAVIEDVISAPPAAAIGDEPITNVDGCGLQQPQLYGYTNTVSTLIFDKSGCKPGTFSLQASSDHSHWKTLAQTHQSSWSAEELTHECLAGTWWYQGYYVADDGSFKGGTDSAYPTKFTC